MGSHTSILTAPAKQKKRLIRRIALDNSQRVRHIVQFAFVLLNAWLGVQFYFWARYFERGGIGLQVPRPPGAEGWLPIAGLMNFKVFVSTGRVPEIHPAAMFLFMAFAGLSLIAKKAFCSWICPVGTLSEALARLGKKIFRRNFLLPRWLDIPLRGLKYLLLAFFVSIIGTMSAAAINEFMHTPYGIIADVKMLNFFRDMSETAAIVLAVLVLLSVLVENFWCRYLCPYGALMGLASLVSPLKIRRNPMACIDCAKCAHACPANLPVDKLVQIRSVECTACMSCIASCPAEDALQFSLGPARKASPLLPRFRRPVTPLAMAAIVAFIFLGTVLVARATNHWQTHLPNALYQELVPNANQATHPGY
ncbi:MAG TPA: 4Fe-4S binding protein [Terracidiphilus sp.]|nr:4Fe-4S binding protein [Terracidiphilus sp.]